MRVRKMVCPLLLLVATLVMIVNGSRPSYRRNSKYLGWDSGEDRDHGEHYSHSYFAQPSRGDRKLVFINNKAYDLTEAEESRVWELYLKKGHVPSVTHNWKSNTHLDTLEAAMMAPVAATQNLDSKHRPTEEEDNLQQPHQEEDEQNIHEYQRSEVPNPESLEKTKDNNIQESQEHDTAQDFPEDNNQSLQPDRNNHNHNNQTDNLKMSRFVADPEKYNLIEKVTDEELEEMYQTTKPPPKIADEKVETETTEVHYEATPTNPLTFIWRELLNLGELLGRELIDTLSGRLMYLWNSLVKFVQARGSRAILDSKASQGQAWEL